MRSAILSVHLFFLNDSGAVSLFRAGSEEGPLPVRPAPQETVPRACVRAALERLGVDLPEARVRVLTENADCAVCLCYHDLPAEAEARFVFP